MTMDDRACAIAESALNPDPEYWAQIAADLHEALQDEAVPSEERNKLWFLGAFVAAVGQFIEAFRDIKAGEFYRAWCALEQVELKVAALLRNAFYPAGPFRIEELGELVRQWQALYPYRVFFSPGIVVRRSECTICGAANTAENNCGHKRGIVYNGIMCSRQITSAEAQEISLVTDPVQKYSVAFAGKGDNYRYDLVEGVARMLDGPFDQWEARWSTALHPHSLFDHLDRTSSCPCGGGNTYENCCAKNEGVRRPHLQVRLDREPPEGIDGPVLAGYSEDQLARLTEVEEG